MSTLIHKLVYLGLVILFGVGCSMDVSVKDLNRNTSPAVPPGALTEPFVRVSPGHVEAVGSSMTMKATLQASEQMLSGATIGAKVSFQRRTVQ